MMKFLKEDWKNHTMFKNYYRYFNCKKYIIVKELLLYIRVMKLHKYFKSPKDQKFNLRWIIFSYGN
jgi:hypothetical protein